MFCDGLLSSSCCIFVSRMEACLTLETNNRTQEADGGTRNRQVHRLSDTNNNEQGVDHGRDESQKMPDCGHRGEWLVCISSTAPFSSREELLGARLRTIIAPTANALRHHQE